MTFPNHFTIIEPKRRGDNDRHQAASADPVN